MAKTYLNPFLKSSKIRALISRFNSLSPNLSLFPSMALRRFISKRFLDSYRPNPSSPPFRRPLHLSPPPHSGQKSVLPVADKLREKLGDRIRLDGLVPPPPSLPDRECSVSGCGISIGDARKIIRLSQVEKLKAKLRGISKSLISYSEFVRICVDDCGNVDRGDEFAKLLDESGIVIVVGNVVFLRPDQLVKSMETMISNSIATSIDPRLKQVAEMEKQKAIIDKKAQAQVRAELFCGMGLILGQTLGFMRLTFWELSWDVMEPICFFTTSLYVPLAFCFFLSTSTEPTFEGFFRRRFEAKQKKLMASHNFDIDKYNELMRICYPNPRNPNQGGFFLHYNS